MLVPCMYLVYLYIHILCCINNNHIPQQYGAIINIRLKNAMCQ